MTLYVPPVCVPRESHEPMRRAIAPELVSLNSAADVAGFIVVALGESSYEVRTDMGPEAAREWLLFIASEMDGDAAEVGGE